MISRRHGIYFIFNPIVIYHVWKPKFEYTFTEIEDSVSIKETYIIKTC